MRKEKMIPDDIWCPYCGKGTTIQNDDGHGCEEGRLYQEECTHCGNTYVFYTCINLSYFPQRAPCLNGGRHKWKPMRYSPKGLYKYWDYCEYCGDERQEVNENYSQNLKKIKNDKYN